MDHLMPSQLEQLRDLLEQERTRLLARAGTGSVHLSAEDLEPADLQDRAREERDRSAELARTRSDRSRLREVEAALLRVEEGRYGLCEETGEVIPFGRLRAEPAARYTVEAQELLEREATLSTDEPGAY